MKGERWKWNHMWCGESEKWKCNDAEERAREILTIVFFVALRMTIGQQRNENGEIVKIKHGWEKAIGQIKQGWELWDWQLAK